MREHDFRRGYARYFVLEAFKGTVLRETFSSGNVDPCETDGPRAGNNVVGGSERKEKVVAQGVQEGLVDEGAWSDYARHPSLECLGAIVVLRKFFAHGDEAFFALYEDLEIPVKLGDGEAAHGHLRSGPFPACELDVEQRGNLGCLVKV